MDKSLPSIKIKEVTYENIDRAIEKYNDANVFQISKQEFRRMSYTLLSQLILTDQLDTITKVVKGSN